MKKLVSILLTTFFLLFPYFLFKIDYFNSLKELNFSKQIVENEFKSYSQLVKEYISVKKPDGYVVDNKIYFEGSLYEYNNIKEGFNILTLNNKEELFYITKNNLYNVPGINSTFLFYISTNEKIMNEGYKFKNLQDVFPDIDNNVTYFNGKKVLFKKIKLSDDCYSIVYVLYPKKYLTLYFVFIPTSILIFYFFFFYNREMEKNLNKNIKKFSRSIKILKNIIKNCEHNETLKEEIKELKKILKEE
jgi:hypothetical protein